MNRMVMKMLLRNVVPAWHVAETASADGAVAAVKDACAVNKPFDVVMMDEDFGFDAATAKAHKTGTAATREIRAFLGDREARRTLIVGATGYESAAHREKALAAGQDGVIGKPYEEEDVRALLLGWLEGGPVTRLAAAAGPFAPLDDSDEKSSSSGDGPTGRAATPRPSAGSIMEAGTSATLSSTN